MDETDEAMDGASAFGRLLLRHRRAAGLSQAGLARASGMSVRALRELERGRARAAQARSAEVLAEALGLGDDERASFLVAAREGRRRSPRVPEAMALCALPPEVPDLVGRERELAWLLAQAAPGGVVAVVGHPGVGKTALAVSAAHAMAAEFAGGALAVDLRGLDERPLTARAAMEKLLRALGVASAQIPVDQDEQSNLLRVLAESREILLLLDNAADETQVRPLLVTGPGCLTLVTSRGALAGLESVRRLTLEPLARSAGVDLLARIAGADRVAAEPGAAADLVEMCGSLPLAVRIVGNRMATRPHWTLAYLVAQLRDERVRLGSLSVGDLQVRSAFEMSYRRLSPTARILFRRLAAIPGSDFGESLASVIIGASASAPTALAQPVGRYLNELTDASLLQVTPVLGRYHFHDLIRIFAAERLALDEDTETQERLRDTVLRDVLSGAVAAARLFFPDITEPVAGERFSTRAEAADWLAREGTNWVAAQRVAARLGRHREVLELARVMHWYSDSHVPERPWEEIYQLGLAAARALGSRADEVVLLNQVGWAQYMRLGDNETALVTHREALAVATELGDRREQAWAHGFMGMELVRLGRAEEALAHTREADVLSRELDDFPLQSSMRNAYGVTLRAVGRAEEALAVHEALLVDTRAWQDSTAPEVAQWMMANVLDEIGPCLAELRRWRPAAEAYREARLMFAANGVGYREARSASSEGAAWRQAGEYAAARECLSLALDYFTGPLYVAQRERAQAEFDRLPTTG